MKTRLVLATLMIAWMISMVGCKKDTFVEDVGVCPVVAATDPASNATNVTTNKVITATFNEVMDPATITSTSFTLTGSSPVAGNVSYNGQTATFTPASQLIANATYTCRITTAAKDKKGNALQEDYVWSFSTGATINPIIIDTDPDDLATGVEINRPIRATFNMPMDPLSINNNTFTLKIGTTPVAGSVSYYNNTATFTPNATLTANTNYTATITTGVQNPANNHLAQEYIWTFRAGTVTAPVVISTIPAAYSDNVARNQAISVTFSEPMDPLTITTSSFMVNSGTNIVVGSVSYAGNTATFVPNSFLETDTTYIVTLTTDMHSAANIPLMNNYNWRFTTVAHNGPANIDLASAARFGILANTSISSNAGLSEIHDLDVGISPGTRANVTGFPPAMVINGSIYASDDNVPVDVAAMLTQAKSDMTAAYLHAENASTPSAISVAGDIGGQTLTPGIYRATSALLIQSGDLTLDAQGDKNATWIFQLGSNLTTGGGAGGDIVLTGGAQAKNIVWQTITSATIGDNTVFNGNILALSSITLNANAIVNGRMLARNGSVVLVNSNKINKP